MSFAPAHETKDPPVHTTFYILCLDPDVTGLKTWCSQHSHWEGQIVDYFFLSDFFDFRTLLAVLAVFVGSLVAFFVLFYSQLHVLYSLIKLDLKMPLF